MTYKYDKYSSISVSTQFKLLIYNKSYKSIKVFIILVVEKWTKIHRNMEMYVTYRQQISIKPWEVDRRYTFLACVDTLGKLKSETYNMVTILLKISFEIWKWGWFKSVMFRKYISALYTKVIYCLFAAGEG